MYKIYKELKRISFKKNKNKNTYKGKLERISYKNSEKN